ncbi:MAG: DinB family protein [Chloroflexota bacterium]|nr:DinB family protein [Chloroflexota bacterium]MDQ5866427.1 DinB family protein [Chloroflexota bacterium]
MSDEYHDLRNVPLHGYDPEVGRWLWALQDTRDRTLKSLEGLTGAELDTKPPGADNTIAVLLYHIALIEADWLYAEALENRPIPPDIEALFPLDARDEQRHLSLLQGVPLEEHLQRLQTIRDTLLEEFKAMTLEDFRRPRHFPGQYDVTPEWVLHHLIQHEAEHRGHIQTLRVLLRADDGR